MQQMDRDSRSARRQRMADGDRSATRIGASAIESQFALHGEVLWRECFVHLDEVHLLQFHLRFVEDLASGWRRPDAHVPWLDTGDGPCDQAAERLQSVGFGVGLTR